jgi:hypothetical protein
VCNNSDGSRGFEGIRISGEGGSGGAGGSSSSSSSAIQQQGVTVEWLLLGCPGSCGNPGSEEGAGCKENKAVGCSSEQSKQAPGGKQERSKGASAGSGNRKGSQAGRGRGSAVRQIGKAAEGAAAGVAASETVTADQIKLLLELLLLIWPSTKSLAQDVVPVKPQGWLLLLAALLQQAPPAVKLQLLEQRGTLLLQLLYQVMLGGECGHSRQPDDSTQTVLEQTCELIGARLGDGSNSGSRSSALDTPGSARPARPVGMVLLVLQSLL